MLKRISWFLMSVLSIVSLVSAQAECPDFVQDAVDVMDTDCAEVEVNQACYGNGSIEVMPQPDEFDSPGDQISIVDIESLKLSELNKAVDEWGIALLSVQANLEDTSPGQNVTLLLFGDVEVVNAGEAMEAFYFSSGVGDLHCNEAPNGILIQSPEDAEEIELTINDVGITLGSTAYLMAEPEGVMTFALLEGSSTLTANGQDVDLMAGEFSTVELDEELSAASAPAQPQPIAGNLQLPDLPLRSLPRELEAESEGDSSTSTGELIIPRNGNWTYVLGEVEASDGCPPGMEQGMQAATGQTSYVDFGGENFDFETWFTTESQAIFEGAEFSSPEPNVYLYSGTIEGAQFEWEMTILSEIHIEGRWFMDLSGVGMDCQVTALYTVDLSE